ncbi:MAG: single-stranded-DNA-specific exonuclease RecJ [Rickettsiales bacterium]|jgi:single-stranded-DNA-specific exonuclease|nr:single-stranded-DNA-specific exonuclease RecJ [Rickettsiales bacterium]
MKKIVERSVMGRVWALSDNNCDSDLLKQILCSRGIVSDTDVQKFLDPKIKDYMPDPFVLRDMQRGVVVVADAIVSGKKVAVFGDYDVDGITSTAIMVKFLRACGAGVMWHLPDREGEGYGLNINAIEKFAADGAGVLLSVDCGISGVNEVQRAKELGMDVVITDHHNPDNKIPDADAVIDPKRTDDESGLNYLAGVGVAFMFLVALNRELRAREINVDLDLMDLLDLVALGTICDTMPLIGLNRAFVATGLRILDLRKNIGLSALMRVAKVKSASVYAAGFALGPRLNAAGRLDSAAPALELLLTDNILIANDLADKLNVMNAERMEIQNQIMLAATDMANNCVSSGKKSLLLCGDDWHCGVMGIIAGRLKDKYNMPTMVATRVDDKINGSGRSTEDIDLGKIIHDALTAGILTEGGGHSVAAGFSLNSDKFNNFCEFVESAVRTQLGDGATEQIITADAELDASAANMGLVNKMSALSPFGQGNPEPMLILNGGVLMYATTMGRDGGHLRGRVRGSDGRTLDFVGFNLTQTNVGEFLMDDANVNRKIKMLGRLKENDYNGNKSVQFVLEDIAI